MAITPLEVVRRSLVPTRTLDGIGYTEQINLNFTGTYDEDEIAEIISEGIDGVTAIGGFPDFDPTVFNSRMSFSLADRSYKVGDSLRPGAVAITNQYEPYKLQQLLIYPLDRDPVISGGGVAIAFHDVNDAEGTAMQNSAEDYYTNTPEQFATGGGHTITLNLAANPSNLAFALSQTMNSVVWNGVAKYKAKIEEITFERVIEVFGGGQVKYWKVTFPLRYNARSWLWPALDIGVRDWEGTLIVDTKGQPVPMPGVALDGTGAPITPLTTDANLWPPGDGGDPPGYKMLVSSTWEALPIDFDPFTYGDP